MQKTSFKSKCHIHAVGVIFKDARTWKERLRTPDIVGSAQLSTYTKESVSYTEESVIPLS